MQHHVSFDEAHVLHELKHYLPTQAPLKDFIHHNTLHAFQKLDFHDALQTASQIFGYKVYLKLDEYRQLFQNGKIDLGILKRKIKKYNKPEEEWLEKLILQNHSTFLTQRVGELLDLWQSKRINFNKEVHTYLFRFTGNYLDQGISLQKFPAKEGGFLSTIRFMEKESIGGMFKSKRVKSILHQKQIKITDLLEILVGEEKYYERYLFEQQFMHPGWSGMVAFIEDNPNCLLQKRKISLHDFIILELLMEIEALDLKFKQNWTPLKNSIPNNLSPNIFEEIQNSEIFDIYKIWQEAYEWTYYDQVLRGLITLPTNENSTKNKSFQAVFCIDDRECSLRRYLESTDNNCETFSSAGFFNVEFYFQPEGGKFFTKSCPAPLTPDYIIKEYNAKLRHKKEAHFSKRNNSILGALVSSPTLGFWSAIHMTKNIFKPADSPVTVSSFKHMDEEGNLHIEHKPSDKTLHNLQSGFTIEEMANRIMALLQQIGMIKDFAHLVYFVGHGASSVNNTHYAGYDCGACSGRAGSVNARVAAIMANKTEVREILNERGIHIPDTTRFVGGLHDTTCDEIKFYDLEDLNQELQLEHKNNHQVFIRALALNSKERSRRFVQINSQANENEIQQKVKLRSLSLFEPRPEWNHATNCLCIIGNRNQNKHLFFDRRAFLNSYDYQIDPNGDILLGIMKAVAPVCGGINLEYYFSKVDNYRLGAGSKLPHNVMGLIGVANGTDGDLRPGLPFQMINIHDPLRLLVTIEHNPDVVLQTLKKHEPTYEWFINNWIHLVVKKPNSQELFLFKEGNFVAYQPQFDKINKCENLTEIIENSSENLPVYTLY